MFDVIGHRRWFFLFSAILTIPGLIFILLTPLTNGQEGLKFSIDYTGGTRWQIHFAENRANPDAIKGVLAAQGLSDSTVQQLADNWFDIKTETIGLSSAPPSATPPPTLAPSASAGASGSAAPSASASPSASPSPSPSPSASGLDIPKEGKLGAVAAALQTAFGPIDGQRTLTTVGAVVSSDLINQAFALILVGSIGILLWITFRFHDVKFGVSALVSLLHDVIVVVGSFALFGTFFGVEIDALFVTAMLTVIGFSVHDTIVVFDRIRENKARHAGEPFPAIVNHSILQTFARSINTSLTVVLTLLALLAFGGASVRTFVLALLIGIISGTYSSIFNASPVLVVWQEWEDRRRARNQGARAARRATA